MLVNILNAHRLVFGADEIANLRYAALAIGNVEGFIQEASGVLL